VTGSGTVLGLLLQTEQASTRNPKLLPPLKFGRGVPRYGYCFFASFVTAGLEQRNTKHGNGHTHAQTHTHTHRHTHIMRELHRTVHHGQVQKGSRFVELVGTGLHKSL